MAIGWPNAPVCPVYDLAGSATFWTAHDVMADPRFVSTHFEAYRADNDPSNPRMSPIHADLRGFPPLLVQVGEQEVFYGEATHLAANARKAGVDVSSEVFEGMWHFWHMNIHTLPEARNALAKVARFTEDCIANRSH